MRYQLLGRSGLRVSELCLGTMTFGEDWGWGASKEECEKLLNTFVDAGGNFIDTANLYTNGTSERILGDIIPAARRERFVIATKYTLATRPDDPNGGGNHRKNLHQALNASLKSLKTDYIDLYWMHAWDTLTPVDEVMRALDDAVRAGKILYAGISDAPAWYVAQANTLADLHGWTRFVGYQIPYSLIERTPERDALPMAQALDLTVTPWGILGAGVLTGKFTKSQPNPANTRHSATATGQGALSDRNLQIAETVQQVAKELNKTPTQIAVAWVLHQKTRAKIIPILGVRTVAQLQDNLNALEVKLPQEALEKLDTASKIDLGFPFSFLHQAETYIFGKMRPQIDA